MKVGFPAIQSHAPTSARRRYDGSGMVKSTVSHAKVGVAVFFIVAVAVTPASAQEDTDARVYREACAACHGDSGRGQPQPTVGFDLPLTKPWRTSRWRGWRRRGRRCADAHGGQDIAIASSSSRLSTTKPSLSVWTTASLLHRLMMRMAVSMVVPVRSASS